MFPCRRSVLFLQRLSVTGSLQLVTLLDASRSLRNYRCSRVYRRLTTSKAVVFRSCLPDLDALNAAASRREYSDARNGDRNGLKLGELESFLSVRSSTPVTIQTRRSSEKTQDERNIQTQDQMSSVSSAEGQRSDEKLSKTQQLRKVFKEYGAVGVSFHIGISLISLGMFYLAVSSGLDMAAVLCKLGFSESVVQSRMAAGTSTFVLAYAIHKLFAPVRISITLVSVPLIVRHLRKTGLFRTGP